MSSSFTVEDGYLIGGYVSIGSVIPIIGMWIFMIFGYFGIFCSLKKSASSNKKESSKDWTPLRLQLVNFIASIIACILMSTRRLLPNGQDLIIQSCMGQTVSFVFFYCLAKWSTYSFLMYKVYIATKADQKNLLKMKRFLIGLSIFLAITCAAIVSVSRGYIFSEAGFCIWKLDGLWIAFAYPAADFVLSGYLMWAFIKPLRASTKDTNNTLLKRVIRENLKVGSVCIVSSFIMHLGVGIGVLQPRLRIQLVTEALLCVDLCINALGLFYSTRKSWVKKYLNVQFTESTGESANTAPAFNTRSVALSSIPVKEDISAVPDSPLTTIRMSV